MKLPLARVPLLVAASAVALGSACAGEDGPGEWLERCSETCGPCETCREDTCEPAPEGSACWDGTCYEGSCCMGCWNGTVCREGTSRAACGTRGADCVPCSGSDSTCVNGTCTPACQFADVSVGRDMACAVTVEHLLTCWGAGASVLFGGAEAPLSPTLVSASARFAHAVVGYQHACGQTRDGSLWCWGDNQHGQLGWGRPDVLSSLARVSDRTGWLRVAAGEAHTCAIGDDSSLWCWGRNTNGELGQQDDPGQQGDQDQSRPGQGEGGQGQSDWLGMGLQRAQVGTSSDWVDVGVGRWHSAGVRQSGDLYSWGRNASGVLGTGSADEELVQPTPTPVPGDNDWAQVQVGAVHTCALDRDERLYCWGSNDHGQLGLGDQEVRSIPTSVGSRQWRSVSAGERHSCGITGDGELFCWGDPAQGQLGLGSQELDSEAGGEESPTRVGTRDGWRHVSAGADTTCALDEDSRLYCWGANELGVVGTGDASAHLVPTAVCVLSEDSAEGSGGAGGADDAGGNNDAGSTSEGAGGAARAAEGDGCPEEIDCSLVACDGVGCGGNGRVCRERVCACPTGRTTEADCENGSDDDCDGAIDCHDSDCQRAQCGNSALDRCCDGDCVSLTSDDHCGACGIECGSGSQCRQNPDHGNHYVCSCTTNAQCVNLGYGSLATCYPDSDLHCNCQCPDNAATCAGQCAGGATCHDGDTAGINYCAY
ncbi:RCC1 domain-containing protein [Myxococcota bacterium]